MKQKLNTGTGGSNYATPSSGKHKSFQILPKKSSSDYGDDEFSDFPSSSEFLKDAKSEFKQPPSIEIPENGENTRAFVDLTTPTGNPTQDTAESAKNLTGEIQPTLTPETDHNFVARGDRTSSPTINTFTSPENIKSSATTMPLTEISGNIPPKRKASSIEETTKERRRKRTERCPVSASPAVKPDSEQRSESEDSPGWEDVDRLLLEEFKDVINFY